MKTKMKRQDKAFYWILGIAAIYLAFQIVMGIIS